MNDPKDAIRERLVALLYGELSEGEARDLRRLIERDPEMRAEWEEISGARAVLKKWELREMVPRLVFVQQKPEPRTVSLPPRASLWARWRRSLFTPAWGVAAAAAVVAVLALSGFRVERGNHMIAFRFGAATPTPTPTPALATGDQYVTRAELDHQVRNIGQAVVSYLDEYSRSQEETQAVLLRTALSQANSQHVQDYRDLRGRIDNIGLGVREDHAQTRAQLESLWRASHLTTPEDSVRDAVDTPSHGGIHE